jgi:thiopurine S-methyltransferase
MKSEFWHQRWEQREISFHQQEINQHLKRHWGSLNVKAEATVFVPLCGKSLDMLWLLGEGYSVIGVELSPVAVKEFFGENQLKPVRIPYEHLTHWQSEELSIYCGDLFELSQNELEDVNAVFDRASLVALPPHMRKSYVKFLKKNLPPDATILLIAMEYDESERDGPPFNVTEKEIHDLYGDTYHVELLETHDLLHANPEFQKRGLSRFDEKIYRITPEKRCS